MLLWIGILIAVMIAVAVGICYLMNRIGKIQILDRVCGERKRLKRLISLLVILVVGGGITLCFGFVNTIIVMLHLVGFLLIWDLILLIAQKIRKQKFKKYHSWIPAVATTVVYLGIGWFLVFHVWETDYSYKTEKHTGNIRVVQFADSHVGTTFDGKGLNKYVDEMNKEKPDVVLITGDFVDDGTSKQDMEDACAAVGRLNTKYGVYFVFGNHDKGYYAKERRGYDGNDLIAELEKNNVKVLQDESVLIDDRFYIIGRQDASEEQSGGSRAKASDLTKDLDSEKYMIMMDHQPNDYDAEAESGVDLVLSGHTHGGQMLPITFMGELLKANDATYGQSTRKNTNFIVTSGISDWEIKFKTGCKSEYVVIDIKGNNV